MLTTILLLIALFAPANPTFVWDAETEKFTATFDAGAVYKCTQYVPMILDDKHGKLHDCGFIDETSGIIVESWPEFLTRDVDWVVFFEAGYPRRVSTPGGGIVIYVDYVFSENIRVEAQHAQSR